MEALGRALIYDNRLVIPDDDYLWALYLMKSIASY